MGLTKITSEHQATYDPDADAAYLQLAEHIGQGAAVRQEIVGIDGLGEVVLDFDSSNRLLGVEVIGAALLPDVLLRRLGVRK